MAEEKGKMKFATAWAIAQEILHQQRSLKHLSGVLEAASQAEEALEVLPEQMKSLEAQRDVLVIEVADLTKRRERAIVAEETKIATIRTSQTNVSARFKTEKAKLRQELADYAASLDAGYKAKKAALDKELKALKLEIADLKTERGKLRVDVDKLADELSSVLKKFASTK